MKLIYSSISLSSDFKLFKFFNTLQDQNEKNIFLFGNIKLTGIERVKKSKC